VGVFREKGEKKEKNAFGRQYRKVAGTIFVLTI